MEKLIPIISLVLFSACGDGSQEKEFSRSPGSSETRHREAQQWGLSNSWLSHSDLPPLASDFLHSPNSFSKNSPVLEDIFRASSLGHLNENIYESVEALGLVSDPEAMSLQNDFNALAPGLHWRQLAPVRPLFLSSDDAGEIVSALSEVQLTLDGIPIHNARIKSIIDRGSITWMTGSKPPWLKNHERPKATTFSLSTDELRQRLSRELNFPEWRFHSPERIYIPEATQARAAYLFTVSAEFSAQERGPAFPLEVAIDADIGQILWQRPLVMHVNGNTQMYVENKATSSQLAHVALPDLLSGETLEHPLFSVLNCQKSPRHLEEGDGRFCKPVSGSNGIFAFNYTDDRYDAIVAFAAITRAMETFRNWDTSSLRSDWDQNKWPGTRSNFGLQVAGSLGGSERRLTVFVSTETPAPSVSKCGRDTTPDNAQYLWSGPSGRGNPEILIGYGGYGIVNCGSLRELGKDMDVVMHEFGHHIVFRGLSNSKQQSVALHEGLSDYLTYAVTGNNLLAENSKPGHASLRSGNLTRPGTTFSKFKEKTGGTYVSVSESLNYPHAIGEFWSAILWEMRLSLGRTASGEYKMDKIVWDSIDLIKSDGGLVDGVLSITESTKRYAERNGEDSNALQKIVMDIFIKYEFARINANGEFQPTDAMGGGSDIAEQPPTTTKKKRWGCGEIASSHRNSMTTRPSFATAWTLFVILALPFGLLFANLNPKRVRNKVRQPIRKNQSKN